MEGGSGGVPLGPFMQLTFLSLLGIAKSLGQELGGGRWEVGMGEPLGS